MLRTIYVGTSSALVVDIPDELTSLPIMAKAAKVDIETGQVIAVDHIAKFLKFNLYYKPVDDMTEITHLAEPNLSKSQQEAIKSEQRIEDNGRPFLPSGERLQDRNNSREIIIETPRMEAMLLEIERGINMENSMLSLNKEEKEWWVRAEAAAANDREAGYIRRLTTELPSIDVDPDRPLRYYEIANE